MVTRVLADAPSVRRHGIPVLGRPDRIVPRTALLRRIRSDPSPIVVVEGPAGSGKTTLLAALVGADPRPSGWLTIGTRHSDPVHLVRALAEVLATLHPDGPLPAVARTVRGADALRSLARLTRALAEEPEPTVLVIDDVYLLPEGPALDVLAILADRFPSGGRIAFGTRRDPGLPIARWQLTGQILLIDQGDLGFDRRECALLLERLGVRDAASLAEVVQRQTEGWAAGVHLMGLSYAQHGELDRAARGESALVHAEGYLRREVLDQLDPATRRMLVRTSHLDVVTSDLADAVCDAEDSGARLRDLADRGLMVTSLDASARSFRYHSLLRDALARELAREPETDLDVRLRALAWYRAAGMPADAVEQALGAGDLDQAADLVIQEAQTRYRSGEVLSLLRWIDAFEAEALQRRPELVAFAAYLHALEGDAPAAAHWAAIMAAPVAVPADGAATGPAPDDRGPGADLVSSMLCALGPEVMLEDADRALHGHSDDWRWRTSALYAGGEAELMLGHPTEAVARFEAIERVLGVDAAVVRLAARAERALAEIGQRRWMAAQSIVDVDRQAMLEGPEPGWVAGLLWLVADARLAIHRGDIQGAHDRLRRVQLGRVRLSWALPWYAVRTLTELARAQLLLGDHQGARVTLSQARETVTVRPRLGNLTEDLELVSQQALAGPRGDDSWSTLTRAELRLLPLLQTYLTIKEIGERLGVSPNTAKTQALSIYGKLGASTRSEAVEAAVARGLLEDVLAGRA